MPLTLRPKNQILDSILSSLLAGDIITDINNISTIRQFSEGVASTQADLDYDLFTLLQSFYITTSEGIDLDLRGNDYGAPRDTGQAASDPVTFTKTVEWIEDVGLLAPQVVQATLADGTEVLYHSIEDVVLRPSGRSISGQGPGTTLTNGVNDDLALNLDGDGVRTISLGTHTSPTAIAAAIQAAVQALTAIGPSHQTAYTNFRCDYSVTTPGAYTLRSGTAGPTSSVVVTVAATQDASATLKLGTAQGGLESVGTGSVDVPMLCDQIGVIGNVGAGQINEQVSSVPGIDTVRNVLAFANGREPASDDAFRQDIRLWLDALGRGNRASVEQAVAHTIGEDGQRHVFSAQTVYGAGTIQVYICDGRSLTVGAQTDVIEDVQDELDGLGEEPGGWVAGGNAAGVVSAAIVTVNVTVTVTLGPTPDLARAQTALRNAIYQMLYHWPVGASLSYSQMTVKINETVVEVIDNAFVTPSQFATNPPTLVGGQIGVKLMPGLINVVVQRA
jgi:uncharacterized phage protein gp47/JayE